MKKHFVWFGYAFFAAAIALGIDRIIGTDGLNLVFCEKFFVMYYIDVIPHFIGGIACGFAGTSIYRLTGLTTGGATVWEKNIELGVNIGFGLCIGAFWEIYEIVAGYAALEISFGFRYYIFSTGKDILMDSLGAWVATYLVYSSLLKHFNERVFRTSSDVT